MGYILNPGLAAYLIEAIVEYDMRAYGYVVTHIRVCQTCHMMNIETSSATGSVHPCMYANTQTHTHTHAHAPAHTHTHCQN